MNSQLLRRILPFVLLAGSVFLVSACDGVANLDVDNKNAPNRSEAVNEPSDVRSILNGAFGSYWDGVYESQALGIGTNSYAPGPHLDMLGDATTTTNAVSRFVDYAQNPVPQVKNTVDYSGQGIMTVPWNNLNAALSSANDVIAAIEQDGLVIEVDGTDLTDETRAGAYLVRGLAHGHLANIFDQAYIQTLDFPQNPSKPALSPYGEVVDRAIKDLQKAADIANNASDFKDLGGVLPWRGSPPGPTGIQRIANSMSARYLVQNSRTKAENEQGSTIGGSSTYGWNKVLEWTDNGIQSDVYLQLGGDTFEDDYASLSTVVNWYYRVDHRVINLMDPDVPARYPTDLAQTSTAIPEAESPDERLCETTVPPMRELGANGGSLFGTINNLDRTPENCFYLYTNYIDAGFSASRDPNAFSVYYWAPDWASEQGGALPFAGGPRPLMLKAENTTLQAEAEIRASNGGGVGAARTLINNGSRTQVGNLPALTTGDQTEVLKAIFYERTIQVARTSPGMTWADLRRRDALFEGTPKHLPIPAAELRTVQRDVYTFGGTQNAGKPGTASGDMAWCSGNNPLVGSTVPSSGCDASGYSSPPASSSPKSAGGAIQSGTLPTETPTQ